MERANFIVIVFSILSIVLPIVYLLVGSGVILYARTTEGKKWLVDNIDCVKYGPFGTVALMLAC